MNSVHLSDKLWNVYQYNHLMLKYKWWWSILFRDAELSLLVRILFTKHLLKRKIWNPWVIMSLGVWFPWKIWPNKFWPLRSSIFSTWTPRHKEEGWFCTNYYYFITNIKIKETAREEAEDVYVTVYLNFKGCIKEGIGNEGD